VHQKEGAIARGVTLPANAGGMAALTAGADAARSLTAAMTAVTPVHGDHKRGSRVAYREKSVARGKGRD